MEPAMKQNLTSKTIIKHKHFGLPFPSKVRILCGHAVHRAILKKLILFHTALYDNLQYQHLPQWSVLLQYVDDLMISSPSLEACKTDT